MPRPDPWSPHWLTLAVVLPLGVLAAVAGWGTHRQLKTAWFEARSEAERLAPVLASGLEHDIAADIREIQAYPDPPLPGSPSPGDEILDGTDLAALEALRDDPGAGLSPAGLPRRALAGLAIHRIDPARPTNAAALERLLTVEAPSILTTRALETLQVGEPAKARWQVEEGIRREVRELNPTGDSWHRRGDRFLHFVNLGGSLAYAEMPDLPVDSAGILPTWAQARLALGAEPAGPEVIAASPVRIGTGLELRIAADPRRIEAPVRRMQRWMFSTLGVSVAIAVVALALLHRTLRRERQLGEMKDQFVASVSHELRAPVSSIRLMADALEAGKVAPETAREFHRLIAREGARLSTLVGNVLDHARIEQGRQVWKMEPCNLPPLVADTLRVMEPLAQEKNIALESEIAPLEASVDAGAIQQALVNLLDNAIKFSPPGSTITTSLATSRDRHDWTLAVTDEGPGVLKSEQSRIFERFYRPGDELRRETQGTGIGLSLVKAIAEAHRGHVSVKSAPNQGSTFALTLPLNHPPPITDP